MTRARILGWPCAYSESIGNEMLVLAQVARNLGEGAGEAVGFCWVEVIEHETLNIFDV